MTSLLGGTTWPFTYVILLVLYVLVHHMFVSQTAQILALFDVFLGVYRLGLLTTGFCLLVFLVVGTPWLLFVVQ